MIEQQSVQPAQGPARAAGTASVNGLSPMVQHPLLTFSVTVISLTWLVQLSFLAVGWPLFPALIVELVLLLTTATGITRLTKGRSGVRSLYAEITRWRIGFAWYAVVLMLLPVATLAVAAVGGTLSAPADELGPELLQYLFLTFVFGALLGNVWEELAWTGFFQSQVTQRHGIFKGALLTAIPFGLIHLPLAFESSGLTDTGVDELLITWTLLLVVAPFFRLLVGLVYTRTRRSVLAVAILHGSFNASGAAALATGGWEFIVAVVAVTPLVALALARDPLASWESPGTDGAEVRYAESPGEGASR